MNVNDILLLVDYITNKNQIGGITPTQFNLVINRAQYAYTEYLIGQLQAFQYGRSVPKVALGQSQNVRARLTPFIDAPSTLTINTGTGIAPYPIDYLYFDAMYFGASNKRIKEVSQDKVDNHYNSVIDPIATNPFFTLVSAGFQFFPSTVSTPKLSYIKVPAAIKYAFTLDTNQRRVYDSGNSVQPLWAEIDIFQIIIRALAMMGVNLQAGMVEQYANQIKTVGA